MMTQKDFERVAQGFNYVKNDPAAHPGTVHKMVQEFCAAAESINPRFDRQKFIEAVRKPGW